MTSTARVDPAAARAAAQQLYEQRMAAVDAAVTASNTARELADQLTAAQQAAARAYADAQRAGWTEEDLTRIGLQAPARRAPGRPPGARGRTARSTGQDTAVPGASTDQPTATPAGNG